MTRTSWPGGGRLRIIPAGVPDACGLLHGRCFLRPGHAGPCCELADIWRQLEEMRDALAALEVLGVGRPLSDGALATPPEARS